VERKREWAIFVSHLLLSTVFILCRTFLTVVLRYRVIDVKFLPRGKEPSISQFHTVDTICRRLRFGDTHLPLEADFDCGELKNFEELSLLHCRS